MKPEVIRTDHAFIIKVPFEFIMEREQDWKFAIMLEFMNLMAEPKNFILGKAEDGQ